MSASHPASSAPQSTTSQSIKTVAIVGAGTMGLGIAQVCVQHGLPTILFDINADMLPKAQQAIAAGLGKLVEKQKITPEDREAALTRLTLTADLAQVQADLIVEAVVERLDVKQRLFQDLARQNPASTIFASNTSSLPITRLAAGIPHPERVVGMHFFNPAPIMKLVEVISGVATAPAMAAESAALGAQMHWHPYRAFQL